MANNLSNALPPVAFILVEPARQANIGAAARAMKTMGFNDLRIVGEITPGPEAHWVAHQSEDVLDSARQFGTLQEALSDVDFAIATSARQRAVRQHYMAPEQAAGVIMEKGASLARAALVFGRESSGLTNSEIARCDAISSIPLAVQQPSLNLGQAVMLYAWCLQRTRRPTQDQAACDPAAFARAREQLSELLVELALDQHRALDGWLSERLALASDYDLGMLLTLLARIRQR